jgi:hypothetical protein
MPTTTHEAGREVTHYECSHVREKKSPATGVVIHKSIPGSPTRVELSSETQVCTICSARLAGFLHAIETGDRPSY